jgi:fibronectin type 3 domain-containing protein
MIAAPTGLAATGTFAGVVLTWIDPIGSNLAKINVYRSETSGSGYALISGAGGVEIGDETYTDPTAVSGTTYYYVITAVDDGDNESVNSNEAIGGVVFGPTRWNAGQIYRSGFQAGQRAYG